MNQRNLILFIVVYFALVLIIYYGIDVIASGLEDIKNTTFPNAPNRNQQSHPMDGKLAKLKWFIALGAPLLLLTNGSIRDKLTN